MLSGLLTGVLSFTSGKSSSTRLTAHSYCSLVVIFVIVFVSEISPSGERNGAVTGNPSSEGLSHDGSAHLSHSTHAYRESGAKIENFSFSAPVIEGAKEGKNSLFSKNAKNGHNGLYINRNRGCTKIHCSYTSRACAR